MADIDKFNNHGSELVFKFDNKEAANQFKSWLCGAGEQDYWNWMEHQEEEMDGPITGLSFNYHTGDDTIPVKCGRMEDQ
jgi:hypothetical protein